MSAAASVGNIISLKRTMRPGRGAIADEVTQPGDLLRERDVAETLRIAPATVKDWRVRPDRYGLCPPYIKIGHVIRYRRSALMKFLAASEVDPHRRTRRKGREEHGNINHAAAVA
jgi:hypothetical protein